MLLNSTYLSMVLLFNFDFYVQMAFNRTFLNLSIL